MDWKMKSATFILAVSIMAGLPVVCAANSDLWSPGQPIGNMFGLQVKEWRTTPQELDRIREAGFGVLRYGIGWSVVEKTPGVYDWSIYDKFIQEAKARHFRSIIILGSGNPLYSKTIPAPPDNLDHLKEITLPPTQPEALAAFARFAAAAAEHYKDVDIAWEMWNEPDQKRFWPPDADAKSYAIVATTICRAIKAANPAAKVIGPGAAGMPSFLDKIRPGFIETVLNSDASTCFDAISVHSYRIRRGWPMKTPESVIEDNKSAIEFIASHMPQGRAPLPMISTEWGYTTAGVGEGQQPGVNVSPEQQADFSMRMPFTDALGGSPLTILYEWRDSLQGDNDPEAHFGITDYDGHDKPALVAIRQLFPRIHDAVLEQRVATVNPHDFVLLLKQPDGRHGYVYWTAREATEGSATLHLGRDQALPMTSRPQLADVSGALPVVTITDAPQP